MFLNYSNFTFQIAKDMERWAKKTNESKLAKSNAVKQAQMLQKEMEAKEEAIRKQIQDEMLTAMSAQTLLQETKKVTFFYKLVFTP